ncbi:MAG: hypothetical protein WBC51_06300 [Vicinamibacterales bacterium]
MSATTRSAELLPAPGIPLLYFALAHVSLAAALAILIVQPGMPAGFFHHPRVIAVLHLVTLGWISSSILGAFYIVAPLALGMPFRPDWKDRVWFGAYAVGTSGVVACFWIGQYRGMAWSALFVAGALSHVAVRAWAGLPRSPAPWPVKVHIFLAFANVLGAAMFGIVIGLNRVFGWFAWAPMTTAFAHGHLAAVGWAVMMVIGLSYRLVPMILPAAMPTGRSLVWSAVLLQAGVMTLAGALVSHSTWSWTGALFIVAGLMAFVARVRTIVGQKRPAPAALPRPDWATWQTHVAFGWLMVAVASGLLLVLPLPLAWMIPLGWIYGVAGLIGFLAQVVVGIQGRLLPMHAWYRQLQAAGGKPPAHSVHALASPTLAKWTLFAWAGGVPVLTVGLAASVHTAVAAGSALLLVGVALNAAQALNVLSSSA